MTEAKTMRLTEKQRRDIQAMVLRKQGFVHYRDDTGREAFLSPRLFAELLVQGELKPGGARQ